MAKKLILFAVLLLVSVPAVAQVDTVWVRRYNAPDSTYDEAHALAVDESGNVYVTGRSHGADGSYDYATIKYNSNGDTLWVRRYYQSADLYDSPNAIALDGSGNVYVTGLSEDSLTYYDYATIKYDSNGDTVWVRRYDGPMSDWDEAEDIAVDGSGNVYVAGTSRGDIEDYGTIKYYPNGDTAWLRTYDAVLYDYAHALAVDGSGNVYVTGESYRGGPGFTDYATIKYNSNGDTAWVRRYDGSGSDQNAAHALGVDGSGNVYVTGTSYGSGTNDDYVTIKYNSNGDTAWVRRYDGPNSNKDSACAIAVDGSGNVYVTGKSDGGFGEYDYDYATIKYDSNGDTMWVRIYDGPGNDDDEPAALVLDDSGNVYVTGESYGSGTGNDYATIKYNPNGDTEWVIRYDGGGHDYAYDVVVDDSGYVYVTGWGSSDDVTWRDYITIKYVQLPAYMCGDVNDDGQINLADPICLADNYFGGPCEINPQASDVNCEAGANLGDAIIIAKYYFGIAGFELNCCE